MLIGLHKRIFIFAISYLSLKSTFPLFFKVNGQWLAPLTSPTPLITLSLSQQWLVAKPNLKAHSTLIEY